jgi:flavin prenyltransferase
MTKRRMVVGISGASGIAYGIKALQLLRDMDIETHLIVSKAGQLTRSHETDLNREQLEALADINYPINDVGAALSSGSFSTMGMIIAPCSMRTLAGIASGMADSLLTRAADVALKERRQACSNDPRDAAALAASSQHAGGHGMRRHHLPACARVLHAACEFGRHCYA